MTLDAGHLTISLGSRDFATEIAALGLQTFQSAPDFGGIFYLGDDAGGTFVDWLGFDDIGHKVRLLQNIASNASSLDFPKSVTHP